LDTGALGRPVRVYNFGRGHYYLSQERVLYERMVVAGMVPDLAVFVDGLNDLYYFEDEPAMTPQLVCVFEDEYTKWRRGNAAWVAGLSWFAAVQRAARGLLYVDSLHFGPELSAKVADCIAAGLAPLGH